MHICYQLLAMRHMKPLFAAIIACGNVQRVLVVHAGSNYCDWDCGC
jgi:hypothetical protein